MKLALAAAFALLAVPAFADEMIDPATLTCKAYVEGDTDMMMKADMAIMEGMKDDAKVMGQDDHALMTSIMTACKAHPDATVMDALHM